MKNFKEKFLKLLRSENTTGAAMTALIIGAVIALNVIVYALTVGFGLYYTPTEELDMSISDASDGKFSSYSGDGVDVIFCRASSTFDDEKGTKDQAFYFHRTAKEFEKKYPNLVKIKYVNILTKRMEPNNELVDLSPYQNNEDGEVAYPLYESSIIFENRETKKNRVVTDAAAAAFYAGNGADTSSYQAYVGEEVFSSMVSWVLASDTKKAYYTTYHGESSEVYFSSMLACAGYEFDILDLRKENVPDDADLVIISNPTQDFEKSVQGGPVSEIDRLTHYLASGGNLYVSFDPYAKKLTNLEALLSESYGISFIETVEGKNVFKNIVRDTGKSISADNFAILAGFADTKYANGIRGVLDDFDSGEVRLRECAALNVSGKAEALLVTSSSSATYANGERTDKEGGYCVGAVSPTSDPTGTKQGNIFVVSSVYLTANDALMTKGCANRDFIYSVFDVVFESNNAPYGCTPMHFNDQTLENFTMRKARIYTALILTLPAAIAVVGIVVTKKRKNR